MLQVQSRARHLAIKFLKPRQVHFTPRTHPFLALSSASPSEATLNSSYSTARNPSRQRASLVSRPSITSQAIRYCSYQRNMCKTHADVASSGMDISKGREILPANVKPVHYDLTLEPDFEKFTYEGTVVIEYVSFGAQVPLRECPFGCTPG